MEENLVGRRTDDWSPLETLKFKDYIYKSPRCHGTITPNRGIMLQRFMGAGLCTRSNFPSKSTATQRLLNI